MYAYLYDENELTELVTLVKSEFRAEKIFLLSGDLGAGKTRFVKEFCAAQKCLDAVSSPTFSLVNEYKTEDGLNIYHMDLYRIETEDELIDIGFEDYLDTASLMFIEWPDLAIPFLEGYIKVHIELKEEGVRRFYFERVN